jgi:flagellar hook-basal body complex protein FliE
MPVDFSIQAVNPAIRTEISRPAIVGPSVNRDAVTFESMLGEAVTRVEAMRTDAHRQVQSFMAGESADPHKMILSVQKADLSFQLFLQVRNKFTQAYQELMRMQF